MRPVSALRYFLHTTQLSAPQDIIACACLCLLLFIDTHNTPQTSSVRFHQPPSHIPIFPRSTRSPLSGAFALHRQGSDLPGRLLQVDAVVSENVRPDPPIRHI